MIFEEFENTPSIVNKDEKGEHVKQQFEEQGISPVRTVVNIDGSMVTYPVMNNTGYISKYQKLKRKAENLKIRMLLLEQSMSKNPELNEKYYQSDYKKLQSIKYRMEKIKQKIKKDYKHLGQSNNNAKGVILTSKKKQKIRNAITYKWATKDEKTKFEFITFTLPTKKNKNEYNPQIDDQQTTKELSKLLENLKRNHGLKSYIWVAERQKGTRKKTKKNKPTNAIHYHCVFEWVNQPIRVQILNLYWLTLLDKLGYQTTTSSLSDEQLKKLFGSAYNQRIKQGYQDRSINKLMNIQGNTLILQTPEKIQNPNGLGIVKNPSLVCMLNPVDRQPINDLKGLKNYLVKYITKNNQKMYSRVYAMTRDLSSLTLSYTFENDEQSPLELDNAKYFEWIKIISIELKNKTVYYTKRIINSEVWGKPYYSTLYEYFKTQKRELIQTLKNELWTQSVTMNYQLSDSLDYVKPKKIHWES